MRRISDSEILKVYHGFSSVFKIVDCFNFPHYLDQKLLFAYVDGERKVYIIFPFDDLSQLDSSTSEKIQDLLQKYELKFGKNPFEVISKLIAESTFKALNIISHQKFLVSLTNIIFFKKMGYDASHTGAGLALNYNLFIDIINFLINENKNGVLTEVDYIKTQIAHELTHIVSVKDDTNDEYDNLLYGTNIFTDGIARFTEYIVSNLYFDHGFTNQIEDATRYVLGLKTGYHQPNLQRYWLGLYICLIIFLDQFREEIKSTEELNRFPQMNFYDQIEFLKNFRRYVRRNKFGKEFLKIGQNVRIELIECKELKNMLILFHRAEERLNLKEKLQSV